MVKMLEVNNECAEIMKKIYDQDLEVDKAFEELGKAVLETTEISLPISSNEKA